VAWDPPEPPGWLVRLNAHADAVGGAEHLVSLDEEGLLQEAIRSTDGLDDFGARTSTGTSILHELLALDPDSRVPLTWELLHPGEALGPEAERARLLGHQVHASWADLQPAYETMHHTSAGTAGNVGC